MSLLNAAHYTPDEMLRHPRHLAMQIVLVRLIQQLRAIASPAEGYAFQRELADLLLSVEGDRRELKRAADRIKKGKAPHPQAPEPQSGRDLAEHTTWLLEHDLCERLARQLRSVGDAFAWKAFGFYRPFILALSRNDSPGPIHGKAGFTAERDRAERAFKEDGHFALLHDLTNCLRIGDITIWDEINPPRTEEIKTNPKNRRSAQIRRINQARAAILDGAPLPGDNLAERLYELDLPLRTHMDLLRSAAEHAAEHGVYATPVPGARVLTFIDQSACARLGLTDQDVGPVEHRFQAALQSAGIARGRLDNNVHATTIDSSARDPKRVPWANYRLDPVLCARLIGDYVSFTVETSGPALTKLLQVAGLDARWVRSPGDAALRNGEVVMEIHQQDELTAVFLPNGLKVTQGITLQMTRSELDRYLIELLKPGTWAAGIKHLLRAQEVGRPWPHYRDEHEIWA
ncbi:hypothetical protein ACIGG5_11860 [Streptomyces sp. NPDC085463]|uniref:hypothetical protein n=1 Tax=Streptomyces sp. NPDC085463 TaxID=3365724 RepID=UPI0037D343D6